jgi:hypothetical protein
LDQQKGFSGNIGEQALKGIVDYHAKKHKRQPDKLAEQCAIREYESNFIKCVMTDISSQIGMSTHSSKTNTMSPVTVGTELPSYFLTTSYQLPNDFPDFTSFV